MPDGIIAGIWQLKAARFRFAREEVVRDLNENTSAVAGQRVRADRAAMLEVLENLERAFDDGVRFLALEIGDESHTARVPLEPRIEKTSCGRTALDAGFIFQRG